METHVQATSKRSDLARFDYLKSCSTKEKAAERSGVDRGMYWLDI